MIGAAIEAGGCAWSACWIAGSSPDERRFQRAQQLEQIASDLVDRAGPIDRVDDVLAGIVIQDGLGLLQIDGHTVPNDLFTIVGALDEVLTALWAYVAWRQRLELNVKGPLASDADPSAGQSSYQGCFRD